MWTKEAYSSAVLQARHCTARRACMLYAITQSYLPPSRRSSYALIPAVIGRYSIYPTIKNERLSRRELMQANNLTYRSAGYSSRCQLVKAGIPRCWHGHWLAKHGYNLTSDTRYFLTRRREKIACVGRKIVAVFGESVSVSVSASWNASIRRRPSVCVVCCCYVGCEACWYPVWLAGCVCAVMS